MAGYVTGGTGTGGLVGGRLPGIDIDLTQFTESYAASTSGTDTLNGATVEFEVPASTTLTLDSNGLSCAGGSAAAKLSWNDLTQVDADWDGSQGVVCAIEFNTLGATGRILLMATSTGAVISNSFQWATGIRCEQGTGTHAIQKSNNNFLFDNVGADVTTMIYMGTQNFQMETANGAGSTGSLPDPPFVTAMERRMQAGLADEMNLEDRELFTAAHPCVQFTLWFENAGARGSRITRVRLLDPARFPVGDYMEG